MENKIDVDIYSDIVCPWCYVGKRRFEKALDLANLRDKVNVTWRPFELNPHMPPEGMDRREYRIKKFGSLERSQALDAQIAEAGRGEGIVFNHAAMSRTPNTFAAHRLLHFAHQQGQQDAVAEALFAAYFCQGRDIGQLETLVQIGSDNGLDAEQVRALLNSQQCVDDVKAQARVGLDLEISSVPTFVVNGKPLVNGAESPSVIAKLLSGLTVKAWRTPRLT